MRAKDQRIHTKKNAEQRQRKALEEKELKTVLVEKEAIAAEAIRTQSRDQRVKQQQKTLTEIKAKGYDQINRCNESLKEIPIEYYKNNQVQHLLSFVVTIFM